MITFNSIKKTLPTKFYSLSLLLALLMITFNLQTAWASKIECQGKMTLDSELSQVTLQAELKKPNEIESVWVLNNDTFALSVDHAYAEKSFVGSQHKSPKVRNLGTETSLFVLSLPPLRNDDNSDPSPTNPNFNTRLIVDHEIGPSQPYWELVLPKRTKLRFNALLRASNSPQTGEFKRLSCQTLSSR